ncbi:uncharacterized protein At4g26485-like [Rutidosis leptorrhynchoides]|uniref:uncharacterized protein At4g26485-like n=1 Tax=Rutidosis leptorrhynchoides TaxID=125765 RepID=UPI003A9938AD
MAYQLFIIPSATPGCSIYVVIDGGAPKMRVGLTPDAPRLLSCRAVFQTQALSASSHGEGQSILLVGEADFSFSMCVAKSLGQGQNITATSLNTKDEWEKMFSKAKPNIQVLKRLTATVIPRVDATKMAQHPGFKAPNVNATKPTLLKFQRIVFNFPHAGFVKGSNEADEDMISRHQELVSGFLKNAYEMLTEDGEVHVRHHSAEPFKRWKVVDLAKKVGLHFREQKPFNLAAYPHYTPKKGAGNDPDGPLTLHKPSLFRFDQLDQA